MAYERLIAHINRRKWWHVPPRDPKAYEERGKFFASSFREAEFWGRPLDEPLQVVVAHPLIGDEKHIEKRLFGKRISSEKLTMKERWALDGRIKKAAVTRGFDSVVLLTPKAFSGLKREGRLPRSMELNIVDVTSSNQRVRKKKNIARTQQN